MSKENGKPNVGATTRLTHPDGTESDMTTTGYEEDGDGDFTISFTLTPRG